MAEEVVLMKGNEAIARAAIRFGVDGYFGYPITPQSEVLETLAELKPWETTGMVVVQAESDGEKWHTIVHGDENKTVNGIRQFLCKRNDRFSPDIIGRDKHG